MHDAVSAYAARARGERQLVAWSALPRASLMLMVGEKERRDRFGYALREALTARGMSERQLAQKLEVDPRQVARWRTGKGLPDLYQTQAIASVLRVSEELFRNPPPVPEPPTYPIEDYLLEVTDRERAVAEQAADVAVDEALERPRSDEVPGDPRPRARSARR